MDNFKYLIHWSIEYQEKRVECDEKMDSMKTVVNELEQALLSIDRLSVQKIAEKAGASRDPVQFIEQILLPALEHIGDAWQAGKIALSQVYMSGRICESLVSGILPESSPKRRTQPRMAICVLSDHHLIGKMIVYSFLRASGYALLDYGTIEVAPLVERVKADKLDILLISVLMLPAALQVKTLRRQLDAQGIDVKLVVGGAPFRFDETLWLEVGADAMCGNASEVVSTIEQITEDKI